MASDVPQGGVWLQMGLNVRNPYFGSAMLLKCHSEKAQLPVASSAMSAHEDMEHHEHMRRKGEHGHHRHDMPEKHEHKEMKQREGESENAHDHKH